MASDPANLLRSAIEASGLSASAFARQVLLREPRTIRRWLSGESPVPSIVQNHLHLLCPMWCGDCEGTGILPVFQGFECNYVDCGGCNGTGTKSTPDPRETLRQAQLAHAEAVVKREQSKEALDGKQEA